MSNFSDTDPDTFRVTTQTSGVIHGFKAKGNRQDGPTIGTLFRDENGYRFGLCNEHRELWERNKPDALDRCEIVGPTSETGWSCIGTPVPHEVS